MATVSDFLFLYRRLDNSLPAHIRFVILNSLCVTGLWNWHSRTWLGSFVDDELSLRYRANYKWHHGARWCWISAKISKNVRKKSISPYYENVHVVIPFNNFTEAPNVENKGFPWNFVELRDPDGCHDNPWRLPWQPYPNFFVSVLKPGHFPTFPTFGYMV